MCSPGVDRRDSQKQEQGMCTRVSSAGVIVDERHGLVDCGPRRLEPQREWFRHIEMPADARCDANKNLLAEPRAPQEVCKPENN